MRMIKGKPLISLTPEEILKRISDYDIYRYYHGTFRINDLTSNYHRGESRPSLLISNRNNNLHHKDFGDSRWKGNCFAFVKQIYNCDFNTALKIIDRDFQLGISNGESNSSMNVIKWKPPEKVESTKELPVFKIVYRKFTKKELDYWGDFYQGEQDLERENIYAPQTIYRNNKKLWLGDELTFCYYYPELERWKLYRPLAPKREKGTPIHKWKWDSGLPFSYCYGLETINDCHTAFVTKGRKDLMVLKTALQTNCICYVQAEDISTLTDYTVERLKRGSKRQVLVFDADKKGKESSMIITKEFSMDYCNVPNQYLQEGINDFPELSRMYDINKVAEHFKQKGFLL